MQKKYNNQRKKNKNDVNSFNISNATKTFKKLVEKNKREEKLKNKKIYYNKTDEFFSLLNNVFFKEEIKETDQDYIFREIKNQNKINQNLVDQYGINAPKKILPYTREPVRFDKKLLFNPLKANNEQNQIRYPSFNDKNKEERTLNLPCILNSNIKIVSNSRRDSEKSLLIKKFESTKDNNTKSSSKFNNIKTESSYFNDKYNYNNTFGNERYIPIKSYNYFTKTNNNLLKLNSNNSGNNNSNTFNFGNKSCSTVGNKSNMSFDKSEYLLTLDNLKSQIRYNQRRHRLYFRSNDYGCELSRDKYHYITKKFFN
jgi:hypothetical protein